MLTLYREQQSLAKGTQALLAIFSGVPKNNNIDGDLLPVLSRLGKIFGTVEMLIKILYKNTTIKWKIYSIALFSKGVNI